MVNSKGEEELGDCPLIKVCGERIGFKFFINYCTDHFDWCPTYEEKTKLRKPREWLEIKEKKVTGGEGAC